MVFAANKKRKKKLKLPIAPPKLKSRRRARQITTEFHHLTRQLHQIKNATDMDCSKRDEEIKSLTEKLEDIGGRSEYQDASILSTKYFQTSKWIIKMLVKMHRRPQSKTCALKVLEVGAINTQLLSCPWLSVRAIDLVSKHAKIEQCDFFTITPAAEYQVVVSSMVLNCVSDAFDRGRMLCMYYEHLEIHGLLFMMLPLSCLMYSKKMTYERFIAILREIGFNVLHARQTPKIAFFCAQKGGNLQMSEHLTTYRIPQNTRKWNDFNIQMAH